MPYIVTTTDAGPGEDFDGLSCERCGINPADTCECSISRCAVATLEEAREAAHTAIPAPTCGDYHGAIYSLPESGGTVGPLPNGTVIEVEHAAWVDIAASAGLPNAMLAGQDIIAAYNARQS